MAKLRRPSTNRLRQLYQKLTDDQIGAKYGVTGRSVSDWRKKHGIERSASHRRRYTLNVDFFEKIDTEEKAYILGLIASDGYVSRAGKQVFIALQSRDEHILRDVASAMGSSAPVLDKFAGGFPGSGPQKYIGFASRKMVSDLARWGIVPGKSHTLSYPKIARHLERHFARGLFDGDGHIRAHPKKAFYFLGTSALMNGLRKAIIRHTGLALKKSYAAGCWRISGYGGSVDVLNWMYRDAKIFLLRKQRVFLNHWQ